MEWYDRDHQDLTSNLPLSGIEHKRYYGFYRARVIDNVEKKNLKGKLEKTGKIEVFIPTLMFDAADLAKGIYAYPSMFSFAQNQDMMNQPPDETDKHKHDYGAFLVPPKGSYVYVFFEDGDPNSPRYLPFSPTQITASPLYEPMNKLHPEKEYYVLKTPHGHRIFLSDNNDRILARTYQNFFVEIREETTEPKNDGSSDNDEGTPGRYIKFWAPEETATKPFGSDAGPIGKGNEDPEIENRDRNDCKGGQESTINCKGGSGIEGSERTIESGSKPTKNYKVDMRPPNTYKIRDDRKKFLGIDDPGPDAKKEKGQKGDPVKGYRGELSSHEKKQFIQFETPKKYLFYMNQHEDDQFIKIQTEKKYRFEMDQKDDKKYIQLETPDDYHFYINCHEDDLFIRAQTKKKFRFEMNEHDDNRFIQAETENHNFLDMNDKEQQILLQTTNKHKFWMTDKEGLIEIMTSSKKAKIILKDDGTISIEGEVSVITKSSYILEDSSDVDLGGNSGKGVITEESICPFTGQPHTDGSHIVKAVK